MVRGHAYGYPFVWSANPTDWQLYKPCIAERSGVCIANGCRFSSHNACKKCSRWALRKFFHYLYGWIILKSNKIKHYWQFRCYWFLWVCLETHDASWKLKTKSLSISVLLYRKLYCHVQCLWSLSITQNELLSVREVSVHNTGSDLLNSTDKASALTFN